MKFSSENKIVVSPAVAAWTSLGLFAFSSAMLLSDQTVGKDTPTRPALLLRGENFRLVVILLSWYDVDLWVCLAPCRTYTSHPRLVHPPLFPLPWSCSWLTHRLHWKVLKSKNTRRTTPWVTVRLSRSVKMWTSAQALSIDIRRSARVQTRLERFCGFVRGVLGAAPGATVGGSLSPQTNLAFFFHVSAVMTV